MSKSGERLVMSIVYFVRALSYKIKYFLKNTICKFLFYSHMLDLFLSTYMKNKTTSTVTILVYHRIVKDLTREINGNPTINHPQKSFEAEMRFLKKWFNIVSLDDAVEIIKGEITEHTPEGGARGK